MPPPALELFDRRHGWGRCLTLERATGRHRASGRRTTEKRLVVAAVRRFREPRRQVAGHVHGRPLQPGDPAKEHAGRVGKRSKKKVSAASARGDDTTEVIETPFGVIARVGSDIYMQKNLDAAAHTAAQQALLDALPEYMTDLDAACQRLHEILSSVDALELLTQFSVPYLTVLAGTPEAENDRLPAHVEFLAMYVLRVLPQERLGGEPVELGEAMREVETLLREIFDLRSFTLTIGAIGGDDSIERELRLMTLLRNITVRMPVYIEIERDILRGLFGGFSEALVGALGFDLSIAERCTDALLHFAPRRLFAKAEPLREQLDEMRRLVKRARRKGIRPGDPAWVDRVVNLPPSQLVQALHAYATNQTFRESRTAASITADELAELSEVDNGAAAAYLSAFTVAADAFDEMHHKYPSATSPSRNRPIIFDSQLTRWVPSVPAYLWDALRGRLEDALLSSPSRDRYLKHRGTYLEGESTRLLQSALPHSSSWTGLKWAAPDGSDDGDIDGLVSYHDCTVRIQAKSGGLAPATLRGAPERMRTDLGKLVGAAAGQHRRLRDAELKFTHNELGLASAAKALSLPLQLEAIVTLDDLGAFVTEAFRLVEYGTLEVDRVPWIVSLHDLKVIVDLLSGPHLLHYLCRRDRLNRWARVYAFEELDWVGHYLLRGLYFDEQLQGENAPDRLRLHTFTDDIDAYYLSAHLKGPRPPRPSVQTSASLERMLHLLLGSGRSKPGTLIACLIALDGDDKARSNVADCFRDMIARSRARGISDFTQGWQTHGLTFCFKSRRGPPPLETVLTSIVERHQKELDAVLWIGVGKTQAADPVTVIRTDGRPFQQAVDRVLRHPIGPGAGEAASGSAGPKGRTADPP